ncbi:UNVERIFIED_CONTAM: hypothetical protein Scaly_0784500 [Sesamum calycinum]|uniref:Replication factor A C-terminal domain-containing protein n=1 Tax=Sesamum calycinum TaxID=2727403 RepID=A0AAW2R9K9_9LAMI
MFPNAHPEKELVLKRYTTVKDAFAPIGDNIKFNFVEFDEIDEKLQSTKELDIYGILVKVKESRTTTSSKGAQKQVREITIINKQYRPIVISLWEDLAKNEGLQLQEIAHQNPIIAIAKVTAKKYLGELQLQSTAASIIQIDPNCEEIQHIQKWFQRNNDPAKIRERAMIQRMIDAKEATLKEIIHNRNSLSQDTYYSFNGTVERVENKSSIWYDSCKKCAVSVYKNSEGVSCRKCNEDDIQTTPRYRLLLNVVHEDDSALITIFEEAATIYVGCTVEEYLTSIEKGENYSEYYRGLSLQTTTEFRFLIALNKKTKVVNGRLNAIAEAIQKKQQLSKHHKRKNTASTTQLQDEEKDEETSMEERQNKKRQQRTKGKKKELQIQISSDDDETLNSWKIKHGKKSMKGSKKKIL